MAGTGNQMTNYLNKLNNIFHGIIAVPLIVFAFLFLELDSGGFKPIFGGRYYYIESGILFLLSLVFIGWLFSWFKKQVTIVAASEENLEVRLERYKEISIRFYLLMTGPGALAIILMFLTGEVSFSLIYILELFLLSLKRPSVQNISNNLNLKAEEREIVMKKKELT